MGLLSFVLPLHTTQAQSTNGLYINEFLASNRSALADPDFGDYGDWLELYNGRTEPVDLSGYYLTDDLTNPGKWRVPDGTTIAPSGFLLFWADDKDEGLHTNFRLSASGETIGLFTPLGQPVDTLTFGPQTTDISQGRSPDGASLWRFFDTPTPEAANPTSPFESIAPPPEVSLAGGFYDQAQNVVLRTSLPNGTIHYTLDGSPPTPASPVYSAPLLFDTTGVLRAAVFRVGTVPSAVITHTYFIGETSHLPIISLVTDPDHFFSDETGIYVEGTNGIPGRCRRDPVNWNQDWERPVHVTLFEPDGAVGFAIDAGVKMFGGCGRIYPQKSLALFARRIYGSANIEYRVFPDQPIDRYNNLVLRSSGQDWWRTMFRDGMIQTVARQGLDLDGQAYRPAVVYLNGAYWGIHNIREKLNAHYVESHYGVDDDDVELLDVDKTPPKGRSTHYDALTTYIGTHDMTLPESYAHVQQQIDVDAYLDYLIGEIYSANADWPGNNLKLWRPMTPDGRWRWMFFDLDFGFGGNAEGQFDSNTLALATAPNGPDWPNPPWSTYLFRKLLEHDTFRHTFIQRLAAHINTTFAPQRVIHVIDSLQAHIAPEIPRHKERWPRSISFGDTWDELVEIMRVFARNRPAEMRTQVHRELGVPGSALLNLDTNEAVGGQIYVYGVPIPRGFFSGTFFREIPLQLVAVPDEGYRFAGWSGATTSAADTLAFVLRGTSTLEAAFVPDGTSTTTAPRPEPQTSRLRPNYPNPATGTTTIALVHATAGLLSLKVYDLLGREQATLIHETRSAGTYHLTFDATHLPSGVYILAMQNAHGTLTQRMVVTN